jgi:hypothetical protein
MHLARALYHAQRDAAKWRRRRKHRHAVVSPETVASLIDQRFSYRGAE